MILRTKTPSKAKAEASTYMVMSIYGTRLDALPVANEKPAGKLSTLMTKQEVMVELGGVCLATVDKLLKSRDLAVVKVGRLAKIKRASVVAYIELKTLESKASCRKSRAHAKEPGRSTKTRKPGNG
jgi:uncharacterized protein related to proFAR isomerase